MRKKKKRDWETIAQLLIGIGTILTGLASLIQSLK